MEWTCTHLRYLLAIYTLSQKAPNVGAAAVARALGVSCPSVTRMLGILTQRGLLERERYGKIHLTDQGLVLARTFSRKVALVTERLPRMELALAEEELYQAACLLAATLPDHVVDAAPIPSPTPRTESATVPPPPSDPASDPGGPGSGPGRTPAASPSE